MSSLNPFAHVQESPKPEVKENPYLALYGLHKNPFPTSPAIQPNSSDERSNGELYDPSIRAQEEQEFDEKFFNPAPGDASRLGLLRYGGAPYARGQGKSAFLYHLSKRVHRARRSEGTDALAVFLQPQLRPTKKFWQILKLVWETLAKAVDDEQSLSQLLEADRLLRAQALVRILDPGKITELAALGGDEASQLLSTPKKIEENLGVAWEQVKEQIATLLQETSAGVLNPAFQKALEEADYQLSHIWNIVGYWSDYRWRRDGTLAFLDGLSAVILASGFSRIFVFLDEYEKIFLYQNSRDRSEFLDGLRNSVFDSDTVAARYGLLRVMLVIHPRVVDQVAGIWSRVGLDRFCPIIGDFANQSAVTLRELDVPELRTLFIGYIDHFREAEDERSGTIFPFSEEAFDALVEYSQGIAGYLLAYAHFILAEAMRSNMGSVAKETVQKVGNEHPLEELDKGISVSLPTSDITLNPEADETS
jgi:hypothetical protein